MNPDNTLATLYWDTFDSSKRGDCKKALESSLVKIRTSLASALQIRAVPQLEIEYDSQYEEESKISALLKEEANAGKYNPDSDE